MRTPAAHEPARLRGAALLADVVRENIEAFAVAIVMALAIKHFCLEAFRIPTSSMKPTLRGENDAPDRQEDRIIVDKWAYLVADPERWEVPVFRYPLDRSRNFIKRIVGLPGEQIRIAGGDILVRRAETDPWRRATKRALVRETLYSPVYPPDGDGTGSADGWWRSEDKGDAWRVESLGRLEFDGGAEARLVCAQTILAPSSSYEKANDVRLRLRVTPTGPGTLTLGWRPEGGWGAALRLVCDASGGDVSAVLHGPPDATVSVPLDVVLAAGRPTELGWEVVDGEVHVHVDGVERYVLPVDGAPEGESGEQALTLTAAGAPLVIERLRIDRDLCYAVGDGRSEFATGLWIPPDAYVMLGDNTGASSDSRAWRAGGRRLKDGREIWYNLSGESGTQPTRIPGTDRWRVTDLDGVERTWATSEEEGGELPSRYVTFVPRENIVGRAFYIFWPALPDFPRRLRWIH